MSQSDSAQSSRCNFEELLAVSKKALSLRKLVEDFRPQPDESYRKEVVDSICDVLEKDLFIYDEFEVKLPPTVFDRAHAKLAVDALSVPQVNTEQEVKQLAFASDFSAEIPMLRVTRLTTAYAPFLKIHIEGAKNATWTMRDCHAFVNGEGFWDVLKQAYGSFKVSAVRSTLYPVHLNESLLNIAEFNASSEVDSVVSATLSTNPAVKVALNQMKAAGDPEFEVQLRFRAQESNQQLLLFAFSVRASQLLEANVNLATPAMGEKPSAPLQPSQQEQQRRKLSPLQLEQLWQTGQFEVPSKLFPGTSHVWELSRLLLTGAQIRSEALRNDLVVATQQIYEVRERIFNSHDLFDVRSSIRNIKNRLIDLVAYTIGVPERQRLYTSAAIEGTIAQERLWHLFDTLKLKNDEDWVRVPSSPLKEEVREARAMERAQLPLVLESTEYKALCVELSPLKFPACVDRLKVVFENVERQWRKDRLEFATREELQLRAQSASSSSSASSSTSSSPSAAEVSSGVPAKEANILNSLQRAMAEEFNRRCFAAIESDPELALWHPRLPSALCKRLHAALIIRREKELCNERNRILRDEFEVNLTCKHPILSRVATWKQQAMLALQEQVDEMGWVAPALPQLDPTSALILRTNLAFDAEIAPNLRERLHEHTQPAQRFVWRAAIWNPKNWPIIRSNKHYLAIQERESVVDTGKFGWRLQNLYQGTITRFSNFNYVVVACLLLNGPLSLRALFGRHAFTPGWKVNQDIGILEKDPRSTQQTLVSRISALWKHARNSRNSFEAQADTGLLGKSITRWFNRFWNWGVVAGVGSVLVSVVMPPLCVLSSALCTAAALASPLLVPAWMLVRCLFSFLIYDFDFVRQRASPAKVGMEEAKALTWGSLRGTTIPLLRIVSSLMFTSLFRPVLALGCAVVVHPLFAAVCVLWGSARWLVLYLCDWCSFTLLLRPLARVPCENGFLQRRVRGPGLSFSWFQQMSVAEALVALTARLERLQLGFFEQYAGAVVDAPVRKAEQVLQELFGPFSSYVSPTTALKGVVGRAHIRRREQLALLIKERQQRFPTIKSPQFLRMTDVDLQETVTRGARLVEKFMTENVFPSLPEESITSYWDTQKLEPGSWNELTRQLLCAAISPVFMEPLGEADKMFRFRTEQVGMSEFLEMVESAAPRDHLDQVTPIASFATQASQLAHELKSTDLSLATGDCGLNEIPHRSKLERSHRVCVRALRGEVPKEKEDDQLDCKELGEKVASVFTKFI